MLGVGGVVRESEPGEDAAGLAHDARDLGEHEATYREHLDRQHPEHRANDHGVESEGGPGHHDTDEQEQSLRHRDRRLGNHDRGHAVLVRDVATDEPGLHRLAAHRGQRGRHVECIAGEAGAEQAVERDAIARKRVAPAQRVDGHDEAVREADQDELPPPQLGEGRRQRVAPDPHDQEREATESDQASGLAPLVVLVSLVFWWRDRLQWAIGLPVIMAGTGALQWIAKWAVDRPRPNGAPWGFPSGHALTVLVFFGLIAYVVWTSAARRRWRLTSGALCVLTILAVGFSRLYLDMHWLSDVGGGLAVGGAYLPMAIWLVERRPARSPARHLAQHADADYPVGA
jgi:hypothetical protein